MINRNGLLVSAMVALVLVAAPARAEIVVNGVSMEVVDTHSHSGSIGDFNLRGKHAILEFLPEFIRPFHAGVMEAIIHPYGSHIGGLAEDERAGIDHRIIVAAYTHHTAGFLTNRRLEDFLVDERNVIRANGRPWAWGFASINLDDFEDPDLRASRIAALRSYFAQRPDLFVGIKLAHVHQGRAFNDDHVYEIYDVAAEFHVPVFHHTGILSVWGEIVDTPEMTDPVFLRRAIERYSGKGDRGRVEFILGHVGTGSLAIANNVLDIAGEYDNVWLDLSDLAHISYFNEQGELVKSTEFMYPLVVREVKARGLTHKLLYANGENRPGWPKAYLDLVVAAMIEASYTTEEIAAVLSGNFYRLCPSVR